MDPNKHVDQGVHLLNRVLDYAPMVREDGEALVGLTEQDFQVVSDLLFRMRPDEDILPDRILDYSIGDDRDSIELSTEEGPVVIERT